MTSPEKKIGTVNIEDFAPPMLGDELKNHAEFCNDFFRTLSQINNFDNLCNTVNEYWKEVAEQTSDTTEKGGIYQYIIDAFLFCAFIILKGMEGQERIQKSNKLLKIMEGLHAKQYITGEALKKVKDSLKLIPGTAEELHALLAIWNEELLEPTMTIGRTETMEAVIKELPVVLQSDSELTSFKLFLGRVQYKLRMRELK